MAGEEMWAKKPSSRRGSRMSHFGQQTGRSSGSIVTTRQDDYIFGREEEEYARRIARATGISLYRHDEIEDTKIKVKGFFNKVNRIVFDPWEQGYYVSLAITSIGVLYTTFFVTGRAFFLEMERSEWAKYAWRVCDTTADIFYIFDMLVQMRKGYLEDGILVTEGKKLAMHYIFSVYMIFDILSILPTDVIFWIYGNHARSLGTVRLNRLLRAHRLNEFLDRTWRISSRPNFVRCAMLTLASPQPSKSYLSSRARVTHFPVHFNAGAYFIVSEFIGFGSDPWVFNTTMYPTFPEQYFRCMYWVSMTFTTGESLAVYPHNLLECCFVVVNVLIGVSVFATIVGNISGVVAELSAQKTTFHNWYEEIRGYMKKRNISPALQLRVTRWFQHYWLQNAAATSGKENALSIIPEKLRAEIEMDIHLDTLLRVRLFQNCEAGILIHIVSKMTLVMFNPGEYICKKGDVGTEMYIIKSGTISVLSDEGKVLATLSSGSAFGEISLLNIQGTKTGNRRTANVISQGYTYLFQLTKEDLWDVLDNFPSAKKVFTQKGKEILIKDGLLDPAYEEKQSELAKRRAGLQGQIKRAVHRLAILSVAQRRHQQSVDRRLSKLEAAFDDTDEADLE